jgi:hypothetical protein
MANESVALICPHCDKVTAASHLGTAFWDGHIADGELEAPDTMWRFLQCTHCFQPIVDWREDYGPGFDADEPAIRFPEPRRLSYEVPRGLHEEWSEAQVCFRNKAYKACAVMVRRTLEGTCKENGITERTLANSLTKMLAEGVIDQTLFDWATELRVVGNKGAHYSASPMTREDAEDALSFAEAFLDHIYVLRKRFADFKERRAKD